jgi:rhomboid protease GluP
MKAATSFGRRGRTPDLSLHPASAAIRPSTDMAQGGPATTIRALSFAGRSWLRSVPLMTMALMVLLAIIFRFQCTYAFDLGPGNKNSPETLVGLGAASYDLVVNHGQIWRLFVAPLLHGDNAHVIGNCIALFFVGLRLEVLVGRAWIGAIFAVSALAGAAGSLSTNPQMIVTVGASGAITGLVGALFAVSLTARIDAERQKTMLRTAAWFGIPALLPMMFAGGSHVDYAAHMAGAIAGALMGLMIASAWSEREDRPGQTLPAALSAVIFAGLSAISLHFIFEQYADYRAFAAASIPMAQLSGSGRQDADRHSSQLVTRYPDDPRGHLLRGGYLLTKARLAEAEAEIRKSSEIAATSPNLSYRAVATPANAVLAVLLLAEGRRGEAQELSRSVCAIEHEDAIAGLIDEVGLCKPEA